MIEVENLRKSYDRRMALDGVSLNVKAGEVLGLLGPNGAGKTTMLSILATLLRPDAGSIRIGGSTLESNRGAIRRALGFVPQSIALYPSLTVAQNLALFGRMQGLSGENLTASCTRALDDAGLAERAADQVRQLSGGMKRRLNIAAGVIHQPSVWLLDEPAVGVDPQSRERILETVRNAATGGAAVIYSSHYMEEVERLCDRVVLLDHGRVIVHGTSAEIIARAGDAPRMEIAFSGRPPAGWCDGPDAVKELTRSHDGCQITLQLANLDGAAGLLEKANSLDVRVLSVSLHRPNLSDAFIALTGHGLRDTESVQ